MVVTDIRQGRVMDWQQRSFIVVRNRPAMVVADIRQGRVRDWWQRNFIVVRNREVIEIVSADANADTNADTTMEGSTNADTNANTDAASTMEGSTSATDCTMEGSTDTGEYDWAYLRYVGDDPQPVFSLRLRRPS